MAGRINPSVRGFTLVELMVTIAVLAILLAAATPSFVDFFDKYRLRGAVDDVISVIAEARVGAVKADRDVDVSFGGSANAWCVGANGAVEPGAGNPAAGAVACDCSDNSPQCLVGGETLRIEPGRHGAVSVSAVTTNFSFDSKLGVVMPLAAQSVTFTSPSGKFDLRLDINALGQSMVCVPNGKPAIAGVDPC